MKFIDYDLDYDDMVYWKEYDDNCDEFELLQDSMVNIRFSDIMDIDIIYCDEDMEVWYEILTYLHDIIIH